MRLDVLLDGERVPVEVDLAAGEVTVRGRRVPFTVVARTSLKVELDLGGERVVVEGWPEGLEAPPGPLSLNGERFRAEVERTGGGPERPTGPAASPTARPPTTGAAAPAPSTAPGGGVPVLPPMPGKVVEVRVENGQHVEAGTVLLVLEAMKMRNEVTAPVKGRVEGLRVRAGASAPAREPMLYLVAE